jgi:hypothetical protein
VVWQAKRSRKENVLDFAMPRPKPSIDIILVVIRTWSVEMKQITPKEGRCDNDPSK